MSLLRGEGSLARPRSTCSRAGCAKTSTDEAVPPREAVARLPAIGPERLGGVAGEEQAGAGEEHRGRGQGQVGAGEIGGEAERERADRKRTRLNSSDDQI